MPRTYIWQGSAEGHLNKDLRGTRVGRVETLDLNGQASLSHPLKQQPETEQIMGVIQCIVLRSRCLMAVSIPVHAFAAGAWQSVKLTSVAWEASQWAFILVLKRCHDKVLHSMHHADHSAGLPTVENFVRTTC